MTEVRKCCGCGADDLADALARVAVLEKALEPIVTEFSCTIEQYYKLGPDFTHKDGTEVFAVQSILDREPLIEAARAALSLERNEQ